MQTLLGYDPWNDYVIRGRNHADDNAEFAKAVTIMNARGRGRIVLDRDVRITGTHRLLAPIGMACLPGGCAVMSTASAAIFYGPSTNPHLRTTYAISSIPAKTSSSSTSMVVSPNVALADGDLIAIMGDNPLTDVTAHAANTKYVPMEVHRVSRAVTGSADTYVLGDFVEDPITINPRLARLTDAPRGIRIERFRMRHDGGVSNSGTNLKFDSCFDVELNDVVFETPVGGQLGINSCLGVRVNGLQIEDAIAANYTIVSGGGGYNQIYGIVVSGGSNDVKIQHGSMAVVRHPLTTGGIDWTKAWAAGETLTVGEYRWVGAVGYECMSAGTTTATAPDHTGGTTATETSGGADYGTNGTLSFKHLGTAYYRVGNPKNVAFCNNLVRGTGSQTPPGSAWGGASFVDAHPESRGLIISGNTIIVPAETQNVGINLRCRGAIVTNNHIRCGYAVIPIRVIGEDCVISNNVIESGFRCVVDPGSFGGGTVDRSVWTGNTFTDFFGPGIVFNTGTGHVVSNNTFRSVGNGYASNSVTKACIHIGAIGSGTVEISGNMMPKGSNDYSVSFDDSINPSQIKWGSGNGCEGYGKYNLGFRSNMWRPSEAMPASNHFRRNADKEYRWVGGAATASSTPPTHSSGTTDNWAFNRNVTGQKLAELETLQLYRTGVPRYSIVQVTGHGLTILDRGLFLNTDLNDLWDDTDVDTTGRILLDVIDDNYLMLADPGDLIEIDYALVIGSYNPASDGRVLKFDASARGYQVAPGAGAADPAPAWIEVNSYHANYVQVRVRYSP